MAFSSTNANSMSQMIGFDSKQMHEVMDETTMSQVGRLLGMTSKRDVVEPTEESLIEALHGNFDEKDPVTIMLINDVLSSLKFKNG